MLEPIILSKLEHPLPMGARPLAGQLLMFLEFYPSGWWGYSFSLIHFNSMTIGNSWGHKRGLMVEKQDGDIDSFPQLTVA